MRSAEGLLQESTPLDESRRIEAKRGSQVDRDTQEIRAANLPPPPTRRAISSPSR